MFIETSAKAGFNIKALFRKLATVLPGMQVGGGAPVVVMHLWIVCTCGCMHLRIAGRCARGGRFTPNQLARIKSAGIARLSGISPTQWNQPSVQ